MQTLRSIYNTRAIRLSLILAIIWSTLSYLTIGFHLVQVAGVLALVILTPIYAHYAYPQK